MPNVNKPSGLTPVKYLNGADWDGKVQNLCILAAVTNAIFVGDVVDLVANADATLGIPAINLAANGGPSVGVVVAVGTNPFGPYIDRNNLTRTSRPTGAQSVNYYAAVVTDPNVIFEAQEDGVGGTIAAASANKNVDYIAAAPATGVLVSGGMIDSSTVGTGATLHLKLMGLAQRYEQGSRNGFGAFAKWLCMINAHRYRVGSTAI